MTRTAGRHDENDFMAVVGAKNLAKPRHRTADDLTHKPCTGDRGRGAALTVWSWGLCRSFGTRSQFF